MDDFLVWELTEGKAIGSAAPDQMIFRSGLRVAANANEFFTKVRTGATVGRRSMNTVSERAKSALLGAIQAYQREKIGEDTLRERATKAMRAAWKDSFIAGLRSGGMTEGPIRITDRRDEAWLKSAVSHEMRFLNRFLDAVVNETTKMPIPRRVQMYVDSLESFYQSARVVALPDNVILRWTGPADKVTCPSCRYLFENNPFTKWTLPCTPRSGTTLCLTNCRDKIIARRAPVAEVQQVEEESEWDREEHLAHLRQIKRTGKTIDL